MYTVLEAPLTAQEIKARQDSETGWIQGVVALHSHAVIGSGLDELLALCSEALIGSVCLENCSYRFVGVADDGHTFHVEVSGDARSLPLCDLDAADYYPVPSEHFNEVIRAGIIQGASADILIPVCSDIGGIIGYGFGLRNAQLLCDALNLQHAQTRLALNYVRPHTGGRVDVTALEGSDDQSL